MDDWEYTWEVTNAILAWWETAHHTYDLLDEEPKFVKLAKFCKDGGVHRE